MKELGHLEKSYVFFNNSTFNVSLNYWSLLCNQRSYADRHQLKKAQLNSLSSNNIVGFKNYQNKNSL